MITATSPPPELHLDNQKLDDNENLVFEPRTCSGLASALSVLNISGCRVLSLFPLHECSRLSSLDASRNLLSDLADILDVLGGLPALRAVDLRGNPVSGARYWEAVVGHCSAALDTVDGRPVHESCRATMRKMAEAKKTRRNKDGRERQIHADPAGLHAQ